MDLLLIRHEETNKSVTKQNINMKQGGLQRFTSLEREKESLPAAAGHDRHIYNFIKSPLCPCQSYQFVITTYLLFITYLAYAIRPKRLCDIRV